MKFYHENHFEQCIEVAREALQLSPESADAWNNICAASNKLGRFEDGKLAAESALRLREDFPNAKANLDWSLRELRLRRHANAGPHSAKILIAIHTCKKNAERIKSQYDTWVPEMIAAGYAVDVFDGERLGEGDDYYSNSHKKKALCAYALSEGYEYLFCVDDDVYIRTANFKPALEDYAGIRQLPHDLGSPYPPGRPASPPGTHPHKFVAGAACWLSARSMRIMAEAPITDWADDRWMGNTLAKHGIELVHMMPEYCRIPNDQPTTDAQVLLEVRSPIQMRRLHETSDLSTFVNPAGLVNRSLEEYNQGDLHCCIALNREALELEPDIAMAWNNICAAYNMLGEFEQARVAGEEAVRLDPSLVNARGNLNRSLRELHRLKPAAIIPTSTKILIAIYTCKNNAERVQAQLDTWVPEAIAAGYDVGVFDGNKLGVSDDYFSLPDKTKALCRYALRHGYSSLLKIDDDSYVRVSNFKPVTDDYAGIWTKPYDGGTSHPPGRPAMPAGTFPHPYAAGPAYWLSARAMQLVANAPITDWAEDRWVGHVLAEHGVMLTDLLPDFWIGSKGAPKSHTQVIEDVGSPTLIRKLHQLADLSEYREPAFLVNQGLAAYRDGKPDEYIALHLTALEFDPTYGLAWSNLCAGYNALGSFEEARKAGLEAVRLQPESRLAKENLERAMRALDQN